MAKLDSEMQNTLQQNLAIVATASKDGIPNAVPKGSLFIIDDETLAYSEGRCEKTLRNIQENPRVSVIVVDKEKALGYQIKGTAELLTSGEIFDNAAKRQEAKNRPLPKYVVKIAAEEIYKA